MGLAGAGAAALPGFLAACSSGGSNAASTTVAPTTTAATNGPAPEALLTAARKDGALNLIAINDDPNSAYAALLDSFKAYSKLKVNLTQPAASSSMELEAATNTKAAATRPDVIDVGLTYAVKAADQGLLARSLPDGWVDVPSAAKDADGLWVSAYYGLIGIVSNKAVLKGKDAPQTPDDLKKLPKGAKMGLPGDPRTSEAAGPLASAEAFAAVWTVALAVGGTFDDIGPGIDFFADLADAGIFDLSQPGIPEVFAHGTLAVTMLNNFEFRRASGLLTKANKDAEATMKVIPADTQCPSYYAQCAVKGSPHPDAAKLWLAYLLSDDGAKAFLKGGAIPTRFPALYANGTVTDADLAGLSDIGIDAARIAKLTLPVPAQVDAAQKVVNERWGPDVKGEKS